MYSMMTKEALIRKLTSRKFWAAIAEFVTMLVVAFGAQQETAVQVSAMIMAGAAVVAYIVGEGMADAAGAAAPVIHLPVPVHDETEGAEETETAV